MAELDSVQAMWGMARRKGFEPLTPRFEVWCSIQLSYRRGGLTYHGSPGSRNLPCV